MSGAFWILDREQAKQLFSLRTDAQVREFVGQRRAGAAELELPRWRDLHDALCPGGDAEANYPLSHCVLGGRSMHQGSEMRVHVVRPDTVRHVVAAAAALGAAEKISHPPGAEPSPSEPSLPEPLIAGFVGVRRVFENAAAIGGAVLFAADG